MATFLFAPVRFRVSIFYTVQYIIITNRCAHDDVVSIQLKDLSNYPPEKRA